MGIKYRPNKEWGPMVANGEGMVTFQDINTGMEDVEAGSLLMRGSEGAHDADRISFIIPAYNEGENIRKNLLDGLQVIREFGIPFEVVVVNDGSTDNTLTEIMRTAINNPEIVPVTYHRNAGKGNALKVGVKNASGNYIVFMDADLEIHPKHALKFLYMMKATDADVVIGSKRHPDSKIDYPAKRKLLSWGYHLLIKALFDLNLTDTQPGFKLFRKEVLEKELVKVRAQRYAFDLDLLVNAHSDGYKIVEASIELNFSRSCGGRIGFKTVKSMLKETMGIYYRQTRVKRSRTANSPVTNKTQP
jgi:glycosyltransferase involved in cell wall biosynthesis